MRKPTEKSSFILVTVLTALFGGAAVACESAIARAFYSGELLPIILHIVGLLCFQALFFTLAYFSFKKAYSKKIALAVILPTAVAFTLLWIFLLGFKFYTACLCVSIVLLSAISLFLFGKAIGRKGVISCAATFVAACTLAFSLFFGNEIMLLQRVKNAPITVYGENDDIFPHAIAAEKIYVCTRGNCDNQTMILTKTLQGILALKSDAQVLFRTEGDEGDVSYCADRLAIIEKYYPDVDVEETDSVSATLEKVGGRIKNYILYDVNKKESISVALSLCNRFNAVMLTTDLIPIAEKYGWKQVFDASYKDEDWLMNSEYFASVSKSILFMLDDNGEKIDSSALFDYVIVSNGWAMWHTIPQREYERRLRRMNRNFHIFGGTGELSENGIVTASARYSGTFIFLTSTNNISTLSGFRLENALKKDVVTADGLKKKTKTDYPATENKHTVCIMLSDADNLRFFTEQALVADDYFGSPLRGEDNHSTFGLSGSAIEIMPISLLSYYDKMYSSEDFVLQISSLGYTYPSKWNDDEAWKQVTDNLVRAMKTADTHVVEIMDDTAFMQIWDVNSQFDTMQKYFDTYTAYEQIDGCLFIDFMELYAGYEGEICWSNGKPVVSARYSVWNSIDSPFASEKNDVAYIANAVNAASTDVTSEDAYTFIIVHAWSGYDTATGKLVKNNNGDTMRIFTELQDRFDEDVEVVGAEEFIRRLAQNVEPNR